MLNIQKVNNFLITKKNEKNDNRLTNNIHFTSNVNKPDSFCRGKNNEPALSKKKYAVITFITAILALAAAFLRHKAKNKRCRKSFAAYSSRS